MTIVSLSNGYQFQLLNQSWMIKSANSSKWLCVGLEGHVWIDPNGAITRDNVSFPKSRSITHRFRNDTHHVKVTAYENGYLSISTSPQRGQM